MEEDHVDPDTPGIGMGIGRGAEAEEEGSAGSAGAEKLRREFLRATTFAQVSLPCRTGAAPVATGIGAAE